MDGVACFAVAGVLGVTGTGWRIFESSRAEFESLELKMSMVVAVESLMSRLSSVTSPSVAVIVVTMVFELSVLVLMVVSEAVDEPITITFGTFWGGCCK